MCVWYKWITDCVNCCWQALARQLPILYNARRRQNLSDVRLKTCAVDCVFYIQAFRDACQCT